MLRPLFIGDQPRDPTDPDRPGESSCAIIVAAQGRTRGSATLGWQARKMAKCTSPSGRRDGSPRPTSESRADRSTCLRPCVEPETRRVALPTQFASRYVTTSMPASRRATSAIGVRLLPAFVFIAGNFDATCPAQSTLANAATMRFIGSLSALIDYLVNDDCYEGDPTMTGPRTNRCGPWASRVPCLILILRDPGMRGSPVDRRHHPSADENARSRRTSERSNFLPSAALGQSRDLRTSMDCIHAA